MRRITIATLFPVLALTACGASLEASGNVEKGPASADAIAVEMGDNVFLPDVVGAKAGEEVTLEITNAGRVVHNFVIPDLEVSSGLVQAGEVVTATFVMPDTETEFVCTLHRGMDGVLEPEGV